MKTFDHYELKYTISNEGIMDLIKSIFTTANGNASSSKLPDKPKIYQEESMAKFFELVKLTYANKTWLEKRGLVKGQVTVNYGAIFEEGIDNITNEIKSVSAHNSNLIKQWLEKNKNYVALIKKIDEGKANEKDYLALKNLKEVKMINGLKSVNYGVYSTAKLDALTEAEVIDTSNKMLKLNELYVKCINSYLDPLRSFVNLKLDHIESDNSDVHGVIKNINDFIEKCNYYYYDGDDEYVGAIVNKSYDLIEALASWLDASVK